MNQKEFLVISITLFLTVIGWIVADLHHVANTQKVMEVNPQFSRPIEIKLDKDVFTILERKK